VRYAYLLGAFLPWLWTKFGLIPFLMPTAFDQNTLLFNFGATLVMQLH